MKLLDEKSRLSAVGRMFGARFRRGNKLLPQFDKYRFSKNFSRGKIDDCVAGLGSIHSRTELNVTEHSYIQSSIDGFDQQTVLLMVLVDKQHAPR